MAMVCCLACRSQPTIFISASFIPSLFGWNQKFTRLVVRPTFLCHHPQEFSPTKDAVRTRTRKAQFRLTNSVLACLRMGMSEPASFQSAKNDAAKHGIGKAEIERMASAFEHNDLK